MDERIRFVARLLDGHSMSEVCREFGISRKTGYKIFNRYKDCGLEGLQVFVRHGADGHDAVFFRQIDVGSALEKLGHFFCERRHHLFLPGGREAAAHTEIEKLERVAALLPPGAQLAQQGHLCLQAPTAFLQHFRCGEAPEVDLVHDGKHEDLKKHDVDLGPLGHDAQVITDCRYRDVAVLEPEDPQEVDEVALHVPQASKVQEFVLGELQAAQVLDLPLDFVPDFAQGVGRRVAAHEAVLRQVRRHRMQHRLQHGELVEVGAQ